jgi:hypothetical protein
MRLQLHLAPQPQELLLAWNNKQKDKRTANQPNIYSQVLTSSWFLMSCKVDIFSGSDILLVPYGL